MAILHFLKLKEKRHAGGGQETNIHQIGALAIRIIITKYSLRMDGLTNHDLASLPVSLFLAMYQLCMHDD